MDMLAKIYGHNADLNEKQSRIDTLKSQFLQVNGYDCTDVFSSSGRIEILGNHTDHNHGIVLVGAISQDIIAAAKKRTDGQIVIKSFGFEDIVLSSSDIDKRAEEKGKSIALVRGVLKAIKSRGFTVGGFDAVLTSTIFRGAGVSSSAAYEVLIAKILSSYYLNDTLSPLEMAKISQFAESEYFGKPCGLLDQSGIAFGGVNHIDFNDNENPQVTTLVPDFMDYSVIITNSGGDHSNLTHEYAEVKNDMHEVSNFFGKTYLREVNEEDFYKNLHKLKDVLGGRPILRAMHFFEENKRVNLAAQSLKNGDFDTFLDCVNQSGESSYKLLQNCYVGGDKHQGIPLALAVSKRLLKNEGAVRVHGGGFAGTVIAFVPQKIVDSYVSEMKKVFGNENVVKVYVRSLGATKI